MANKCTPHVSLAPCEETVLQPGVPSAPESFSFCLPFGGKVSYNGELGQLYYSSGNPPEDGTYSKIIIADGCIVGAEKYDPPVYTSTPCAPVPCPCGSGGGDGSSLPDPSSQAGNLFSYDASSRPLVKVTIKGSGGITVKGTGTAEDPIIISGGAFGGGSIYLNSGNEALTVDGGGGQDDPYVITHKTGYEGTINGMKFDAFGHLTGFEKGKASAITGIVGSDGIDVSTNDTTGVVTVKLSDAVPSYTGNYTFGGYQVTIDKHGLVTGINKVINTTAKQYDFGSHKITLNESGSITEIEEVDLAGVTTVSASKVYADVSGESTRTLTVTLAQPSAFRISYKSNAIPNDLQVYVDDVIYTGYYLRPTIEAKTTTTPAEGVGGSTVETKFTITYGAASYEVQTQATFSAGTHTIQFNTNPDTGFTDYAYVDVWLTTVL